MARHIKIDTTNPARFHVQGNTVMWEKGIDSGGITIYKYVVPKNKKVYFEFTVTPYDVLPTGYGTLFASIGFSNGLGKESHVNLNSNKTAASSSAVIRYSPKDWQTQTLQTLNGSQYYFDNGDVVGIVVDLSKNVYQFLKNGALIVDVNFPIDLQGCTHFTISSNTANAGGKIDFNFGESNFKYPMPNGCISYHEAIQNRYLYQNASGEVYGIQNGQPVKLKDSLDGLSDAEKEGLFKTASYDVADINVLQALGDIKVLVFSYLDDQLRGDLYAVPKDQLILPQKLFSTQNFASIHQAKMITDVMGLGAVCKVLVTTDLSTYQTYDFATLTWQTVDHADLSTVKMSGIDAVRLEDIPASAWNVLTGQGLGFAYLLAQDLITDKCAIDQIGLEVDLKGEWEKAVHGMDYQYSYPQNDVLRVKLLTDGDYKINYYKGK